MPNIITLFSNTSGSGIFMATLGFLGTLESSFAANNEIAANPKNMKAK